MLFRKAIFDMLYVQLLNAYELRQYFAGKIFECYPRKYFFIWFSFNFFFLFLFFICLFILHFSSCLTPRKNPDLIYRKGRHVVFNRRLSRKQKQTILAFCLWIYDWLIQYVTFVSPCRCVPLSKPWQKPHQNDIYLIRCVNQDVFIRSRGFLYLCRFSKYGIIPL